MRELQMRSAMLAIACTLMFGACNLANRAPAPNDDAIKSTIQSKLYEDSTLKARDVRVDSQEGVVTLTGTVNTDAEKALAEQFAGQPKGVKQVIDQLTVSPPAPVTEATPQSPPAQTAAAGAPEEFRATHGEKKGQGSIAESTAQSTAPSAPTPQHAAVILLPAGSVVTVRMIDGINSRVNQIGQTFAASVASPIVVGRRVVVPQGADATVRLANAASSGKFRGRPMLQLELVSLRANGNTYRVRSGYYQQRGGSRGKRTAETVGGGAALGAIIGAIAGGGKGAAIGAGVGAGAGTGVQALTKGASVKVPSETKIDFTLKAPVRINLKP